MRCANSKCRYYVLFPATVCSTSCASAVMERSAQLARAHPAGPSGAWSPYPPPPDGAKLPHESDESLYLRIAEAYGMWGAFLGEALEARGTALDDFARHVGIERKTGS